MAVRKAGRGSSMIDASLAFAFSIVALGLSILNLIALAFAIGKVFFSTHRVQFQPIDELVSLQGKEVKEEDAFSDPEELKEMDDAIRFFNGLRKQ